MELKNLGKTGLKVPEIGMGTWKMGHSDSELQSLRLGIKLGMTFIDTAEMYGSEKLVGRAVQDRRDEVFIATKVSGSHLNHDDVLKACESSLRNLNVDCIDLYQVHWPNLSVPISETMRAMEKLAEAGKIRFIGVSNFSVEQMKAAQEALSKHELVSNQVEYSLLNRAIEHQLLPYCAREKITVIAYSPLAQGSIPDLQRSKAKILDQLAERYKKTRCQVALNYVITDPWTIAIPKAAKPEHIRENAGAGEWRLSAEDIQQINRAFPEK